MTAGLISLRRLDNMKMSAPEPDKADKPPLRPVR